MEQVEAMRQARARAEAYITARRREEKMTRRMHVGLMIKVQQNRIMQGKQLDDRITELLARENALQERERLLYIAKTPTWNNN